MKTLNRANGLLALLLCGLCTMAEGSNEIYAARCASCHADEPTRSGKDSGPTLEAMANMGRAQIRFALTRGKMQMHARDLSEQDLNHLIAFLAPSARDEWSAEAYLCANRAIDRRAFDEPTISAWGLDARNTRYQPNSELRSDNVQDLELAWALGLPETAEVRSQVVVAGNTVFASSVGGHLFALDRTRGCIKWHRRPAQVIRTSLTLARVDDRPALVFGGALKESTPMRLSLVDFGQAVFAVAADTGETLWAQDVALFRGTILTGGIVQHGARLLVPLSAMGVGFGGDPNFECCKSHGAVRALDANTGRILWTAHMTAEAKPTYKNQLGVQQWGPSGASVWTTPTIDAKRNLAYVGTGQNSSSPASAMSDAIVAIDIDSGAVRWVYQGTAGDAFNSACLFGGPNCPKENGPDLDFGASAVLARTSNGKDILLAGQKSGVVHALNPETGDLRWRTRVSPGSALGGVHWGMAVSGRTVIVPINDPVPGPGVTRKPGVYALDIDTGRTLWAYDAVPVCDSGFSRGAPWPDCPYTFSAAPSTSNDLAFVGSLSGVAYAFDVRTGKVVWQFDTAATFDSVNGIPATGGSIDAPGMVAAGDMLFVGSGYAMFGENPGNALLAFRLKR
tara:strand:- start:1300 stop:3165 length:1866 start_codon:yes stop_codon:yes gene_type:complete